MCSRLVDRAAPPVGCCDYASFVPTELSFANDALPSPLELEHDATA